VSVASIVLFTRDLRLHDHPALTAAIRTGGDVVPLFVLDPSLLGRSPNRDRFMAASLGDLDRLLQKRGATLVLRQGTPAQLVREVAKESEATVVHMSADGSAYARRREVDLREALGSDGVDLVTHPGNTVIEPGALPPPGEDAYPLFTPYFEAWTAAPRRGVLPPPDAIRLPSEIDPGPRPASLVFPPDSMELPNGGESWGRSRLERFLSDGVGTYRDVRNDMGADATSKLSPYLRFGCLSANEMVSRLSERGGKGANELIRQLAWRDFFADLLASDPSLEWRDLRESSNDVRPLLGDHDQMLERWIEGRTGIPLVDAAMRQLRREGWIHNRARTVAASFLTRRLGIPWQQGAEVFMRYLVDGDPASNSGNWQSVAGTGSDPQRSRALNPVRQAMRFDPDAAYIRRYIPQLKDVSVPLVFAPWKERRAIIANGYVAPIIDVPET
jgi:deoxyribodipyrimidine photo-lyase